MAAMLSAAPAADWVARGDTDFGPKQSKRSEDSAGVNPLAKTFRAAVLLTGGVRQAEAAMLDAIQRIGSKQVSDDTFLLDCVRASLAPGRQSKASEDTEDASSVLAPELKRILLLAPDLRHSLVLRVLLGLSDDDCARLNIRDASQRVRAAVQELARIREAERATC